MAMRRMRSRFSFGRFFMLPDFFGEQALEREHDKWIGRALRELRGRLADQPKSIRLGQVLLKILLLLDRILETRNPTAGLRASVHGVDENLDPLCRITRFAAD